VTIPGQLDTQRIAADRFWHVARQGTLLAVALHTVFAIAGLWIGAMPLVVAQLITISLYCGGYAFATKGKLWVAIGVAWLDLLVHATLACWIVGVDSGFQYYSWLLLPLVFTSVQRSLGVKIAIGVALSIFYVFIDGWLHQTPPLVKVDPGALAALRYFNIAFYLLSLGVIVAAHGQTVGRAERRLNALASTDTLTGLLNRRRMADQMHKELLQARSSHRPLSVLLLDIDNFKSINDQFGHGRGDQVIIATGEILRANVRQQDLIARWGGEEFLILQPGADVAAARETAERVRQAIFGYLVRHELDGAPVTVTIGVATLLDGETLEEIIHRADESLYAGKNGGRNRVVVNEQTALLRPS
jgi:diguanylate cyclase